jgi:hypothetical protein
MRRAVLRRAEGLYIGQPISEVERIMGSSGYVQYVAPIREIRLFGLEHTVRIYAANAVKALKGKADFVPTNDQWPVAVHFDPRTGRVFQIKKGDVWLGTVRPE